MKITEKDKCCEDVFDPAAAPINTIMVDRFGMKCLRSSVKWLNSGAVFYLEGEHSGDMGRSGINEPFTKYEGCLCLEND